MRKLILIVAIGLGIFQYFTKHQSLSETTVSEPTYSEDSDTTLDQITSPQSSSQFSCQGKTHCSQMRSYEEAKFYLDNCPGTQMDGDGDGIPCERQFGRN